MDGSSFRVRDVLVSATLLAILCPVLLVVAMIALVVQGSPVLFSQERPGRYGRGFRMYKFRTMRTDVGTTTVLDDAERITRFGALLRRTSIDELPGLWNVLTGDMSLVGPRPLLPDYLDAYSSEQHLRHLVRPGLTGLAQVSGRNATSWQRRLELDVRYVRTRSHRQDLLILARSVGVVLARSGISQPGHATMPRFDE